MARGGRPRDPRVDKAILDATVPLYSEVGWAGFSFDLLARRSGVGKPAVYRRWDSKETLIVEAVTATRPALIVQDLGGLTLDLRDIASQLFDTWTSDVGHAWTRLQVEQRSVESLGALYRQRTLMPLEDSARAALERARSRGELRDRTSTRLVLSMIAGAIMARVLNTPTSENAELLRTRDEFLDALIATATLGISLEPAVS